jgi:hypothetical protein
VEEWRSFGGTYHGDANEKKNRNREEDLVGLDAPPTDVEEEVDRRAKSEKVDRIQRARKDGTKEVTGRKIACARSHRAMWVAQDPREWGGGRGCVYSLGSPDGYGWNITSARIGHEQTRWVTAYRYLHS